MILSWSGGKDSALSLYYLSKQGNSPSLLFTTVNKATNRISMHGVREELLDLQAKSVGIRVKKLYLPEMPDMATYENQILSELNQFKIEGGLHEIAFGDIFLEDLKSFRESLMEKGGYKVSFPLWKIPSYKLVQEFIEAGFKAIIICVNNKFLDKSFLGRTIDSQFLKDLPREADPAGENGEYHSFVYDGPGFNEPIKFMKRETVFKSYAVDNKENVNYDTGFWYLDLLPVNT